MVIGTLEMLEKFGWWVVRWVVGGGGPVDYSVSPVEFGVWILSLELVWTSTGLPRDNLLGQRKPKFQDDQGALLIGCQVLSAKVAGWPCLSSNAVCWLSFVLAVTGQWLGSRR